MEKVERLLDDIRFKDEATHAIVQELREVVHSIAPEATEGVKYGGLVYPEHDLVCGIFAYARHVSVEFTDGAFLPDPHGVLEGGGKRRRHIKLRSPEDVSAKHVGAYVEAAFDYAGLASWGNAG